MPLLILAIVVFALAATAIIVTAIRDRGAPRREERFRPLSARTAMRRLGTGRSSASRRTEDFLRENRLDQRKFWE